MRNIIIVDSNELKEKFKTDYLGNFINHSLAQLKQNFELLNEDVLIFSSAIECKQFLSEFKVNAPNRKIKVLLYSESNLSNLQSRELTLLGMTDFTPQPNYKTLLYKAKLLVRSFGPYTENNISKGQGLSEMEIDILLNSINDK